MTLLDDKTRGKLLADLTAEAKTEWVPPPQGDLDEATRALFARIDGSGARALRSVSPTGRARLWGPVAFAAAIAAGVALYGHAREGVDEAPSARSAVPAEPPAPVATRPTAPAVLTAMTEGGDLLVDGTKSVGATLRDGTSLEARGGTAAFAAPGRVAWLLESGTEVGTVRAGSPGGAIVLALQVGAVGAQVTPVPDGEAFAVDVDGVRVAVHGTHLRVARAERGGSRVVVDLSEGVVLVGAPPKAGSTVGTLVWAPAHVEFSVADLRGTLRVDHDPAHVRPAVDPTLVTTASTTASAPSEAAPEAPPEVHVARAPSPPSALSTRGAVSPAIVAPPPPPQSPEDRLAAAVRTCADRTAAAPSGRRLSMNSLRSTVVVDVKDDGRAGLAVFDPPLDLDTQACVTDVVYAISWGEPGRRRIPIEWQR